MPYAVLTIETPSPPAISFVGELRKEGGKEDLLPSNPLFYFDLISSQLGAAFRPIFIGATYNYDLSLVTKSLNLPDLIFF